VKPSLRRPFSVLALPLLVTACTTNGVDVDTTTDDTSTTAEPTTTGDTTEPPTTTTGEPDTSTGPAPETSTTTVAADESTTTGEPVTTVASTGEVAVCGNNIIEGDEACDLAQVNGETCESLGFQGGELGCLLTCEDYNLLGCFICGNEVVDIAEDCEGGVVPQGVTCQSLGFQTGQVTCGADCLFDTSGCSICGDGVQQGPEDCDGLDYGGETCASLGLGMGNLACNLANCQFVFTGCSGA